MSPTTAGWHWRLGGTAKALKRCATGEEVVLGIKSLTAESTVRPSQWTAEKTHHLTSAASFDTTNGKNGERDFSGAARREAIDCCILGLRLR